MTHTYDYLLSSSGGKAGKRHCGKQCPNVKESRNCLARSSRNQPWRSCSYFGADILVHEWVMRASIGGSFISWNPGTGPQYQELDEAEVSTGKSCTSREPESTYCYYYYYYYYLTILTSTILSITIIIITVTNIIIVAI